MTLQEEDLFKEWLKKPKKPNQNQYPRNKQRKKKRKMIQVKKLLLNLMKRKMNKKKKKKKKNKLLDFGNGQEIVLVEVIKIFGFHIVIVYVRRLKMLGIKE